jgi:hypothetical protein
MEGMKRPAFLKPEALSEEKMLPGRTGKAERTMRTIRNCVGGQH